MPRLKDECDETEVALDKALCNFINNAADPYKSVDGTNYKWVESVRKNFRELSKAYNDWYAKRMAK